VAAACESRQSGIQSWCTVDGLLWTFFNGLDYDDTITHFFSLYSPTWITRWRSWYIISPWWYISCHSM